MIVKLRSLVVLLLLAALAGAGWLYHFAHQELLLPDSPFRINLKTGSSMTTVARQLSQSHLLSEPWRFIVLARVLGMSGQINAVVTVVRTADGDWSASAIYDCADAMVTLPGRR